jgi:hypothetical protein
MTPTTLMCMPKHREEELQDLLRGAHISAGSAGRRQREIINVPVKRDRHNRLTLRILKLDEERYARCSKICCLMFERLIRNHVLCRTLQKRFFQCVFAM